MKFTAIPSTVSASLPSALLAAVLVFAFAACGGGQSGEADTMAEAHETDTPEPSGMATEPAAPVNGENVTYGTIDGEQLNGYTAYPVGASTEALPGVIMIHEWWGLNDNIRTMARRLAGEGYRVLAVDLYGGRVAETPEAASELISMVSDNPTQAVTNLRSAVAFLRETHGAPRVGVIGWCFGGGQAANAAAELPTVLDATVIYYGFLPTDRERLANIDDPVLGLFGAEDSAIPVEGVRTFEQTLSSLGKDVEVVIYDGARHAFANPSGTNYQAEAATDSWVRTVAFFAEHLQG